MGTRHIMILIRDATKYIAVGEEDITLTDLQELVNSIAVTPNVEMSFLIQRFGKCSNFTIRRTCLSPSPLLRRHKHLTGEIPKGQPDSPRERSHLGFDVFAARTGGSLSAGAGEGAVGAEVAI
jgi:hypothetical protein